MKILLLLSAVFCIADRAFGATVFTNAATGDSYVYQGSKNSNYGTETLLKVKTDGSNQRDAYVKFSISGYSQINTATLRLNVKMAESNLTDLTLYKCPTNSWGETTITWNNRPAYGTVLNKIPTVSTNYTWYELDVSAHVRSLQASGTQTVAFALHSSNGVNAILNIRSREHADGPQLLLTTNAAPYTYLISPTNNATVVSPSLQLLAHASDPDGTVTNVAFYTGSMLIGSITTPVTNQTYAAVVSLSAGSHALTTVAQDNLGLSYTSAVHSVSVTNILDVDTNGIPDLLEDVALGSARPFNPVPFVVTGAFEAEQFDAGGPGVGYYSTLARSNVTYRYTHLEVVPSDDSGAGYALLLRSNEWARYSFIVQMAGEYVVSTRVRAASNSVLTWTVARSGVSGVGYTNQESQFLADEWMSKRSVVYLPAGSNTLNIACTQSVSNGMAIALNYISIYPHIAAVEIPTNFVVMGTSGNVPWVEGEAGKNYFTASNNSRSLSIAMQSVIASGGGTVFIPTGTYYLAQHEYLATPTNRSSIYLTYENIIAADGETKTNGTSYKLRLAGTTDDPRDTVLKAHNRTTMLLGFRGGRTNGVRMGQSDYSFENITFQGNPHTVLPSDLSVYPEGVYEPGNFVSIAYTNTPSFGTNNYTGSVYTNPVTWTLHQTTDIGTLIMFKNTWLAHETNGTTEHVVFSRCRFVDVPNNYCVRFDSPVKDLLFVSNEFSIVSANCYSNALKPQIHDANGVLILDYPWRPIDGGDGVTWNGHPTGVAIHLEYGATNVVLIDNVFNGNDFETNKYAIRYAPDGFLHLRIGGNWYLEGGEIKNYEIEGLHFTAGPAAVVRTRMASPWINGSPAIQTAGDNPGVAGNLYDYTYSLVGNDFRGVRIGLAAKSGSRIQFCGNLVSNSPPILATNIYWADGEGCLVTSLADDVLINMSGNFAVNSGFAFHGYENFSVHTLFSYGNSLTNISKISNVADISGAKGGATLDFRRHPYGNPPALIVVSRSEIGAAVGFPLHVELHSTDAANTYLLENRYYSTNGASGSLNYSPGGGSPVIW